MLRVCHWSGQDVVWTFQFGSWDGREADLGRVGGGRKSVWVRSIRTDLPVGGQRDSAEQR